MALEQRVGGAELGEDLVFGHARSTVAPTARRQISGRARRIKLERRFAALAWRRSGPIWALEGVGSSPYKAPRTAPRASRIHTRALGRVQGV